jgi:hypothetical protein
MGTGILAVAAVHQTKAANKPLMAKKKAAPLPRKRWKGGRHQVRGLAVKTVEPFGSQTRVRRQDEQIIVRIRHDLR